MLFRKVWGALVSFAIMAYLARVLSKEDFGLVAISAVFIQFIQLFATSGISEYVIFYKGEDEKRVVNSAFWLNALASIGISIVIVATAPLYAQFYKDERITNIVYLLIIGFVLNMQVAIPTALYRKTLNYRPLIAIQTIFGTISNITQAVFAYLGFGVYSLVLPNVIISPLMVFFLFLKSDYRPSFSFGISDWKHIFNYTKHVIGQRVFGKIVNQGDTFLAGRFFGMKLLSVYNLAFQFSSMFLAHFLPIITNVSLPVLAKNNQNIEVMRNQFFKMISLISFLTLPVIAGMAVGAEFLITTIYGDKWIEAVLPFQLLSVFVFFKAISSPTSSLFNAMGKPKIGFYFTSIFAVVFIITLVFAGTFGSFIGFVAILVLLRVIGSLINISIATRLVNETLFGLLKTLFPQYILLFVSILVSLIPAIAFKANSALPLVFFIVMYFGGVLAFRNHFSGIFNQLEAMLPHRISMLIARLLSAVRLTKS